MKRVFSLLLLLVLLCGTAGAEIDRPSVREGLIAYCLERAGAASRQEWLGGALSEGAGSGSDWYVFALLASGAEVDPSGYADALERYAEEHTSSGIVPRRRAALLLTFCGHRESGAVKAVLDEPADTGGVMNAVFALHLRNVLPEVGDTGPLIDMILSVQKPDGGWAVTGEKSDADVTAMVLQALAPCCAAREDVRLASEEALGLLSGMQAEDGCFSSYGARNPESCAQVLIALTALGIDPMRDERFRKNGKTALDAMCLFRNADGSFSHAIGEPASEAASAQALCALTALDRFEEGRGSFYLLSSAEAPRRRTISGRAWAIGGTLLIALVWSLVLLLRGKRGMKHYLLPILIPVLAAAAVLLIRVEGRNDYYTAPAPAGETVGSVTMCIRCDVLLGVEGAEGIPEDGMILSETELPLGEGESVFDLLTAAVRANGLQMEHQGGNYIEGLDHLYEFGYGDLSGWIYLVNGVRPSVGCGEYRPSDGDRIEFVYSLSLGKDLTDGAD